MFYKYVCSCLCPIKVQARRPWHTHQLSGLPDQVNVLVVIQRKEGAVALRLPNETDKSRSELETVQYFLHGMF